MRWGFRYINDPDSCRPGTRSLRCNDAVRVCRRRGRQFRSGHSADTLQAQLLLLLALHPDLAALARQLALATLWRRCPMHAGRRIYYCRQWLVRAWCWRQLLQHMHLRQRQSRLHNASLHDSGALNNQGAVPMQHTGCVVRTQGKLVLPARRQRLPDSTPDTGASGTHAATTHASTPHASTTGACACLCSTAPCCGIPCPPCCGTPTPAPTLARPCCGTPAPSHAGDHVVPVRLRCRVFQLAERMASR